jgi:hypothetical protein
VGGFNKLKVCLFLKILEKIQNYVSVRFREVSRTRYAIQSEWGFEFGGGFFLLIKIYFLDDKESIKRNNIAPSAKYLKTKYITLSY